MKTIHKYELQARAGVQSLKVRKGAKLLKIAEQGGKIFAWYEVDTHQDWQQADFMLYETGALLAEFHDRCEYVDTLLLRNGVYVLHAYKINPS